MFWWCSGISPGLPFRRSEARFPDPPVLVKCANNIRAFAYAIFFGRLGQMTEETMVEG